MWSRRKVLAVGGGLMLGVATDGCTVAVGDPAGPPGPLASPEPSPVDGVVEARRNGWTVVTDFGAVGDGRSRPLSTRYASTAAAQRDFPGVTGLDAELDGVAIQAAIDSGADRLYYPPGRYLHDTALVVRDGQRHVGAGPGTVLVNVRRRDTVLDDTLAHSFQIGNIHPAAMVPDDPDQGWVVRGLAPVAAGVRSVTVQDPVAVSAVATGDIVMIRSDNPPTTVGNGVIYDFQMWNRVTAWDPTTGTLGLELPVPRDIVAVSTSPTVLSGPRLCLNAGSDRFTRQPWSFVRNVEIGWMRLDSAGLSARNAVWHGSFHDLVLDAENMITFNALVGSTVERVTGTWSARMIEIKHSSHGSAIRDVTGTYQAVPGVPALTAVSVGEQSFDCSFDDVECSIGPACDDPIRALELFSPDLRFRGTLRHYGSPAAGQVWAVKSNDSPANPPVGIDLDLTVRTGGGFAAYGVIGSPTSRPSYPADVTLRLDQRSDAVPPATAMTVVGSSGTRVVAVQGDAMCADTRGGAEPPTGIAPCA